MNDIAFSADGAYLLSCDAHLVVRLWNVEGGWPEPTPPIFGIDPDVWREEREDNIDFLDFFFTDLSFLPGSALIGACCSWDDRLRFWNWRAGMAEEGLSLAGGERIVHFAVSSDGRWLATGGVEGTLALWSWPALDMVYSEQVAIEHAVGSMVWSPDGMQIAFGLHGDEVRLWDFAARQVVGQGCTEAEPLLDLCFSPNGRTLVASNLYRVLVAWDIS